MIKNDVLAWSKHGGGTAKPFEYKLRGSPSQTKDFLLRVVDVFIRDVAQ
jgi:hypothetical protein